MAFGNDEHETDDKPVGPQSSVFETAIDHKDQQAMRKYEAGIKGETMEMTGREVNMRLSRIDTEIKRLEEVKTHLVRLKRITKRALLGVASNGGDE